MTPHIVEAVLGHVSGSRGGVAGVYNLAAYEPDKRAAMLRWDEHLMAAIEGRDTNISPVQAAGRLARIAVASISAKLEERPRRGFQPRQGQPLPPTECSPWPRPRRTIPWLSSREAVARVARHLGCTPEDAELRIVGQGKAGRIKARGVIEGGRCRRSRPPGTTTSAGTTVRLRASYEITNLELCFIDLVAAGLLPAPAETGAVVGGGGNRVPGQGRSASVPKEWTALARHASGRSEAGRESSSRQKGSARTGCRQAGSKTRPPRVRWERIPGRRLSPRWRRGRSRRFRQRACRSGRSSADAETDQRADWRSSGARRPLVRESNAIPATVQGRHSRRRKSRAGCWTTPSSLLPRAGHAEPAARARPMAERAPAVEPEPAPPSSQVEPAPPPWCRLRQGAPAQS